MQRRLIAIMAADLVGYSALVEKDEIGALQRVAALKSEFISPLIARHRGRLVKQTGDGFLVEFGSAINAVQCGLDWQMQLAASADTADLRFRIGLHLGDIVVEEDDVFGDGVNIAARLEGIAPAGGLALSAAIHEQVDGKLVASFENIGLQKLKNIERPVNVWTVRLDGPSGPAETPVTARRAMDLAEGPSMAVLPFANLTGDPAQDYLSQGIADQLATTLGYVPWFFVSAQAASFAPEFRQASKVQIGRRLGVRYLIDGSLQRSGDHLRISVHLSETVRGQQIWARNFSGSLDSLFDLQDRLAETVIGEIEPRMRQLELRRSQEKHGNLGAYDLYLRALHYMRSMTQSELDQALVLLRRAIELNAGYSVAHGLIAWLMTLRVPQGQSMEFDDGLYHAEQAVRLGRFDSQALSLGGYALGFLKWDPELGLQYLRESLSLNPNSARTYDFAAWLLLYAGKAEEALQHFDHSLELSPVDEFAFRALTGRAFGLLFLGKPEEAVSQAKLALTANPDFTVCHRVLAVALLQTGARAEARQVIEELLARYPALTVARYAAQTRFVEPGYKALLLEGLRAAGLPEG